LYLELAPEGGNPNRRKSFTRLLAAIQRETWLFNPFTSVSTAGALAKMAKRPCLGYPLFILSRAAHF
jgi:hypothetical protein